MLDKDLEYEEDFKTIRELCWHWCPGHDDRWHHPKVHHLVESVERGDKCFLQERAWCPPCLQAVIGP